MKERTKEKDALGLLSMFVVSWLMNSVTRGLLGYDVSFDPINALIEGIGDWDEEESGARNTMNIAGRLGGEVLSAMPMGTQIADYLIPNENSRRKIFGDSDPTRYGTGNIGLNMLLKPAISAAAGKDFKKDLASAGLNIGLPFGGRQAERTIEGLGAVKKGGSFSKDSEGRDIMQYPIFNSSPLETGKNYAQAALFGKSSLPTAQDWVKSGFDSSSAKETAAYKALSDMGADSRLTFETIRAIGEQKKLGDISSARAKKTLLDSSHLTDEQKAVLYDKLLASDSEKMRAEAFSSAGISDTQSKAVSWSIAKLEPEAGKVQASDYQKVSAILGHNLSEKQKTALVGVLYSSRDDSGNVKEESLLPYLKESARLLKLYSGTKDSELISMTVPQKFSYTPSLPLGVSSSLKKKPESREYALTEQEKKIFKDAYVSYFNSRMIPDATDKAVKKLRSEAYDAAKAAVVAGRG